MTQPGEQRLASCPTCTATGANVYRARGHDANCVWAATEARYCSPHNDILAPDESMCPTAGNPVPDFVGDPHERLLVNGPS